MFRNLALRNTLEGEWDYTFFSFEMLREQLVDVLCLHGIALGKLEWYSIMFGQKED